MDESPQAYTNEKDRCNVIYAYNALHSSDEKRRNHCIRLRPSIHHAVREYCHDARMNIGEMYENAAILFMELNPPQYGLAVSVTRNERKNSSIRDKIKSSLLIKKVTPILEAFRNLKQRDVEPPTALIEKLDDVFKKYDKISHPTEELNNLIEEAIEYV